MFTQPCTLKTSQQSYSIKEEQTLTFVKADGIVKTLHLLCFGFLATV